MSLLWYPDLAAELARRDVKHADIAEAVGCATNTIRHIIRGRAKPSDELQQRIADYLDGEIDTLFAENDEITHIVESRLAQNFAETVQDDLVRRTIALRIPSQT